MSRNAFEVSVFTLEADRAPSPSPQPDEAIHQEHLTV